jgi:proteasome lid subunit RPN8/RPN11
VRVSREIYARMIDHARGDSPNECCGILGVIDGSAVDFYPARNSFESPLRFEIHPDDLFEINRVVEERGQEMAIFHSHPNSEARPSQTDVNLARWWPGLLWVICSLADDEPVIRAFAIDGAEVEEVELSAG